MPFSYSRTIHFHETDAAGVVYFANVLTLCHEAYEASLAASGIDLRQFFSGIDSAIPVVHADVDFLQPIFCGDRIVIQCVPTAVSDSEFEIRYQLFHESLRDRPLCFACTRHVCIQPEARKRQELPAFMAQWLDQWRMQ